MASGRTARFYESLWWRGWEAEVSALRLDQGITVHPFLWTTEARWELAATSRLPVWMSELLGI